MAAGDLDGDGKPDLVTALFYSDAIAVVRNTSIPGSLSFDPIMLYATGVRPYSVRVQDLNGDEKPEIVATSTSDNTIYIYKNTSTPGAISFAAPVIYATGSGPYEVAIGDLDGDGKPDLATINYNAYTVSVFRNLGTAGAIAFGSKTDYATQGSPSNLCLGDVDGDGKPEILVGVNGISVFRNVSTSGNILFMSRVDFSSGLADGVVAEDVDNDGKPDLVTSGYVLRNIMNGATPTITAGGAATFCQGGNVLLTSSAATNNQWYKDGSTINGATGISLLVTDAGTYTATTTVNGSTSSPSAGMAITVTALPPKPVISVDAVNGGLISSSSTGNQWYTDTTVAITGATGQSFKPGTQGYYSVRVTQNGCSSPFSTRYNYVITAIIDLPGTGNFLQFAPNPVNNFIGVTYNFPGVNALTIQVTDLNGRTILTDTNVHNGDKINTSLLPAGMYILKAWGGNGKINVTTQIIKR